MAMLAADVVGYSRLVGVDEAGTIARLRALRMEFIEPLVAQYRGRLVKLMGDGALVAFASAVDAVECAVALQGGVAEREAAEPEGRRIRFRIGVNVGDVIVDGDDLYGDGVNIAARLEGLAPPGHVLVSGKVFDEVRGKLTLDFHDLGAQAVKNIAEPIRIYQVTTAMGPRMASPTSLLDTDPPLPDKASIAVLPFQNMSGDAEQQYFADGMVEEIITALSRFRWLLVIARNSTFTYKGRPVDVRRVSSELGVRYVMEGSVRKAGQRVRISGQLIDAATGAHIWADRFEGGLEDIFDFQDRIAETVAGALEPRLIKAETERSRRKRPESLDAYDHYLRALQHLYKFDPENNSAALALLEKAIALDPHFAPALAYAAWCYEQRLVHRWPSSKANDREDAVALARAVLALDSEESHALAMAGFVLLAVGRDAERGLAAAKRAFALTPNSTTVCWMAGVVHNFAGDPQSALPILERALRLSPTDPQAHFALSGLAMANLLLGRYTEAVEMAHRSLALHPDRLPPLWALCAANAWLGRTDAARMALSKLLSLAPETTISRLREQIPFTDPKSLQIVLEGFRKAGLPE
jgi:adenylate cyclase